MAPLATSVISPPAQAAVGPDTAKLGVNTATPTVFVLIHPVLIMVAVTVYTDEFTGLTVVMLVLAPVFQR